MRFFQLASSFSFKHLKTTNFQNTCKISNFDNVRRKSTVPAPAMDEVEVEGTVGVNGVYEPGVVCDMSPELERIIKNQDTLGEIKERCMKNQIMRDNWTPKQSREAYEKFGLMTWGAHSPSSKGAIHVARGEGCYFYDHDGKKYLDFNSQAMCSNLGHTPPKPVVEAVLDQLNTMPYAYPCATITDVKAKLCSLFSDLFPGDINTFFFPSSGAEANEAAIRLARKYTGKRKIMSRYRSYHGGTFGTLSLTGDFRNPKNIQTKMPDVVHFFDPYPYSFQWGRTEEEITHNSITYLEETIKYEDPSTVAAIILEPVTGTNGILIPPKGYLERVRALCDKYEIALICDEVMSGFGRTGKWFGFQHSGIIPDFVTFAKGVNGAFIPLGGLGMNDKIAEYFQTNPVGVGSTYNGHPVALASAYANVLYMLENDVVQNAANMEKVIIDCMNTLKKNHPSFKQGRAIGCFSAFDIKSNSTGTFSGEVHDVPSPAMVKFRNGLINDGVWTLARPHSVFCNPPLIINEQQIREGFNVIDKNMYILDEAME